MATTRKEKASAAARRRLFVEAYIANGGNGTKAAIAAGFSVKSAGDTAKDLLAEPRVAKAIEARQEYLAEKFELKTERILQELSRIAYFDVRKCYRENGEMKAPHELDDDTAAAVASLEVEELFEGRGEDRTQVGFTKKLKAWDKGAAIRDAMKHLGLFEKDNRQSAPVTIIASPHDERL